MKVKGTWNGDARVGNVFVSCVNMTFAFQDFFSVKWEKWDQLPRILPWLNRLMHKWCMMLTGITLDARQQWLVKQTDSGF